MASRKHTPRRIFFTQQKTIFCTAQKWNNLTKLGTNQHNKKKNGTTNFISDPNGMANSIDR
jgi:hypothetical protein